MPYGIKGILLIAALTLPGAVQVDAEVAAGDSAAAASAGPQPGDILGKDNWQLAKDMLPPEILKHYERGEYRNRVVAYPQGTAHWEKSFVEATEKNAGTLDVDERGTIIDKATGKQPDYYYGIPFPNIDPKDPKAGVKAVWNQFLAYWNGGNSFNQTAVLMLSTDKIERNIAADGWFQFIDGQAPKYRRENPLICRAASSALRADRPTSKARPRSPGATATPANATRSGPSFRCCGACGR